MISGAVLKQTAVVAAPVDTPLAELARRAATDDLAFRELYDRIKRPLFTFIFRMVGHMGEAEELMQETLLKIHRNLGRLRADESFLGWCFTIARNTAISHLRRRRAPLDPIDSVPEPVEHEAVHASAEVTADLQKMLLNLPPKYRSVFILGVLEQREYAEIAKIMGKSLAAVKADIHRARGMVREQWVRTRGPVVLGGGET